MSQCARRRPQLWAAWLISIVLAFSPTLAFAQKGGGKGGGRPTPAEPVDPTPPLECPEPEIIAAVPTVHAGRAYALEANVEVLSQTVTVCGVPLLGALCRLPILETLLGSTQLIDPVPDTGPLSANGGMISDALLELPVPADPLVNLNAAVLEATVVGTGDGSGADDITVAVAQTLGLDAQVLSAFGTPLLSVGAGVLRATSSQQCIDGTSALGVDHGAVIADLELSLLGMALPIPEGPVPPNTDLLAILPPELAPLVSGKLVLNEQFVENGQRVVNALHIDITIAQLVDLARVKLIVSHAASDLACGAPQIIVDPPEGCPPVNPEPPRECPVIDFVTGGGNIVLAGGEKGNFGLVGGKRPSGLKGNFTYLEKHRSPPFKLSSKLLVGYSGDEVAGSTTRVLTYDCGAGVDCVVTVADNGEPAKGVDTFHVVAGSFVEGGMVFGNGNIQLHQPKSCQAKGSGGDAGGGGPPPGKGGGKKK